MTDPTEQPPAESLAERLVEYRYPGEVPEGVELDTMVAEVVEAIAAPSWLDSVRDCVREILAEELTWQSRQPTH